MEKLIAIFDHILEKMPDAARIEIRSGEGGIMVERCGERAPEATRHAVPADVPAGPPARAAGPEPAVKKAAGTPVKSPIVGTYYSAPSPDAPPFAAVGQRVKKGQTLCIIEAMKMMNEIDCERDGVVTEILAKNGSLVEFGQTLMLIEEDA